ncbi:MAG: hypothetical protein IJA17_01155 [Oscillospiraceae bacterium]|nr:hypothetical protein [Oscillospiraceae bacterium]
MNCAEILHTSEIVIGEILFCIHTTSGEKHISDAVLKGFSESYFEIQFVQILKETVFFVVFQSFKVVGHVIFYSILCGREESITKLAFILKFTKSILQSFGYGFFKIRQNFPSWNRSCKSCFMGIGNIEEIPKPSAAGFFFVKKSNAGGSFINPPAENIIPFFNFEHGG